jgi:t-SNARE complex subunit (syntaxin)
MLDYKSKGIHKYIFERICQIQDEILMNDKEYQELGKIPSKLFHKLFEKLSPEDKEILDQYSSESILQLNRQDEILYSYGLMDGIILCRWIERIERGERI